MNQVNGISVTRLIALSQWERVLITLLAACGLPFMFHALPFLAGSELGAVWLPIFYGPLIAALFFRPHVALIASVAAPLINHFLFAMPSGRVLPGLMLELVAFSLIVVLLGRKQRVRGWQVLLLMVAVRSLSILLLSFNSGYDLAGRVGHSWLMAAPGIMLLAVIAEVAGKLRAGQDL